MPIERTAPLRGHITQRLLDVNRRGQKNWVVVNIPLTQCRKHVPLDQRLDLDILDNASPKVVDDLKAALQAKFGTIKSYGMSINDSRLKYSIELQGDSVVYATVYENRIKLEAHGETTADFEELRRTLNDFKLDMCSSANTDAIIYHLLTSKRGGRSRAAKLMARDPDPRYIGPLRDVLFHDKSSTVRREAVRALCQLDYAGRDADPERAVRFSSGVERTIIEAFIFGNRFEYDPASERAVSVLGRRPLPRAKAEGVLLGSAVGDTVGRPVEFLSRERALDLYGEPISGVEVSVNPHTLYGQCSDDTELPMLMTEAIDISRGFMPQYFAGLLAEHIFQIDTGSIPNDGYGKATTQAGRSLYSGMSWTESGVPESTCGGAIRVAPLALFYNTNLGMLEEVIVTSTAITNNTKTAFAGAVAVGLMVAKLLQTAPTSENLAMLMGFVRGRVEKYDCELAERLDDACAMANDNGIPVDRVYERLGNSASTLEVVPLAFYSFFRTPWNYRDTVLTAVNAGGDTDSAGSIAGGLSGALNGVSVIPGGWLHALKDAHLVYSAARKLSE